MPNGWARPVRCYWDVLHTVGSGVSSRPWQTTPPPRPTSGRSHGSLTLPMPKGRGFLGCSQRTRHAHPKVKRCDRLTRALGTLLSAPLPKRTFPQALRYCMQSTTRRARVPFIPRTEVRGLLTEKDNYITPDD